MQLALRHAAVGGIFQRVFYLLTKWRLLTEYPHAGMVKGGRLYHANLSGGLHAQAFEHVGWTLIEVPDLHDMEAIFGMYEGAKYDWFSLLGFILPWRVRDRNRFYCYEWCWLAMTGKISTERVTPEMLILLAAVQNSRGA